jgi:hypothetical protein
MRKIYSYIPILLLAILVNCASHHLGNRKGQ